MSKTSHWVTADVVSLLSSIPTDKIGKVSIQTTSQGGDVDSTNLLVTSSASQGRFHICGFTTNGDITMPDDCQVEMVEVTDGKDSRGGVNSRHEPTVLLHTRICAALEAAGFSVVDSLKAYF